MKCSFCAKEVVAGYGFKQFKRDGSYQAFCSNKCFRNQEMGRNPRKLKWTGQREVAKTQAAKAEKAKADKKSQALAKEAKSELQAFGQKN